MRKRPWVAASLFGTGGSSPTRVAEPGSVRGSRPAGAVGAARRVDGDECLAIAFEADVHAVPRRPRNLADDHAFGLGQGIDECALPRVPPADDRELECHLRGRLLLRWGRQSFNDLA